MGWVSVIKTDKPLHRCPLPNAMEVFNKKAAPGSVWECGQCRTRYLYKGVDMGLPKWEKGYPK